MNMVMKRLTAVSTILMSVALVSGIYGMNFDEMPELRTKWGYPLVMSFMAALVFGMIRYFKYKKWF